MQFEYVEVKTKQDVFLGGFYTNRGNKSCAIFIPGLSGNFMENKFARVMGEYCVKNDIDFLFAHNQGSFQIANPSCLNEDGKLSSIIRGAAYESFDDCVYDLDAWLNFLSDYENVYIIAHSLGCNKTIHYLQEHHPHNLKKLVLLAPQDIGNFPNLSMHDGMQQEAQTNIANGQADRLLSKKFLGYCVISSHTYLGFINNKHINNIPYKTQNGDMSALKKIECPVFVVIGSKEDEKAEEYMQKIASTVLNGKSVVIPGANHVFKNQEETLSDKVIEFLLNQ